MKQVLTVVAVMLLLAMPCRAATSSRSSSSSGVILPLIIWKYRLIKRCASSTVRSFTRSIISEAEACEIAQPLPIKPASSILPSFTRSCSVMSSPQLGFTPSRLWVAPSTGWRFSLLRLFSVMIWVYSSFRFTGPSPF